MDESNETYEPPVAPPQQAETVESINDRWKHRRMMAWVSMFSLVICAALSVTFPQTIDASSSVLVTILGTFTTIIIGYMGFATYDDVSNRPGSKG